MLQVRPVPLDQFLGPPGPELVKFVTTAPVFRTSHV